MSTPWWSCGGDGMVNLGLQAVASTDTPLGHHPRRHRQRRGPLLRHPAQGPGRGGRADASPGETRTVDLARCHDRYYVTVMAAGFDAVVNERANRMTWPRGQMRYNLATLAELRTFQPLPYILDLDGTVMHLSAMLVAVGNGPSFGGGLRIAEGAVLDDGFLDVVVIKPMSKLELVRTYPKLFKGTHTTHPQYEHHRVRGSPWPRPGIVGLRRRRAVRPAAADDRVRAAGAAGARMSAMHPKAAVARRAVRRLPPGPAAPGAARLRGAATPSRSTTSRCAACREIEDGRGVLVAAPDRLGQDGGGGVRRPPGPRRAAASASTRRRSRRCRTRSTTTSWPGTAPRTSAC